MSGADRPNIGVSPDESREYVPTSRTGRPAIIRRHSAGQRDAEAVRAKIPDAIVKIDLIPHRLVVDLTDILDEVERKLPPGLDGGLI
jgi:hypothetical protein